MLGWEGLEQSLYGLVRFCPVDNNEEVWRSLDDIAVAGVPGRVKLVSRVWCKIPKKPNAKHTHMAGPRAPRLVDRR